MICLSLGQSNYSEIIQVAKTHPLIELRLDLLHLTIEEVKDILQLPNDFIVTFRKSSLEESERYSFLKKVILLHPAYIDFDINDMPQFIDLLQLAKAHGVKTIISYHNFQSTPTTPHMLEAISNLEFHKSDFIKFVVTAQTEADVDNLLSVYDKYSHPNKLIAFCMGELGIRSRVEALFKKSPFAYISLPNKKTAPGQISKEDFNILFHKTKKEKYPEKNFGVTGEPILHSRSPELFNSISDFPYSRIIVNKVSDIIPFCETLNIKGLNITAPYKKEILNHVHNQSDEVKSILSANCLVKEKTHWKLYNSDGYGFLHIFNKFQIKQTKALIIGAGGTAAAAIWALKKKNIQCSLVNRTFQKAEELQSHFNIRIFEWNQLQYLIQKHSLIIYTIPPPTEIIDDSWISSNHIIIDVNYSHTPLKTKCVQKNASYISGEELLIGQAIRGYEYLLNSNKISNFPHFLYDTTKINKKLPLAIIGFMGAGKSTVGHLLSKKLQKNFIDLDDEIEKNQNRKISEIFQTDGEVYFRHLEYVNLKKFKTYNGIVSCGGGIIENTSIIPFLKNNFFVIYLFHNLETMFERLIDTNHKNNRPLLSNNIEHIQMLYEKRLPLYFQSSDLIINTNHQQPDKITERLYEEIHLSQST